ncbi:MAG: starch synthase [Flavobacteriales bacterium]|jgi:starch synthase
MKKAKVLYVSQEITPFLQASEISKIARELPQGISEKGKEIRVFMPRYGSINERRHQLHEVIRLSGMNLIIDDSDHPLIIKVASIPTARMQVYFIDNEDYFQRKAVFSDDKGTFFKDNDERSIFFCRGVLETVKKLGWSPDVVHCHGWMTGLMPLYIKKMMNNDPHFSNSKVVYSAYKEGFEGQLDKKLINKLEQEGFDKADLALLTQPTADNLDKFAVSFADAIVKGSVDLEDGVNKFIDDSSKPTLAFCEEETLVDACSDFYDEILAEKEVLAD